MKVSVKWRPELQLATIDYEEATIDSEERFQQWQQAVLPRLEAIHEEQGHRFPLVVAIDELSITPEFSGRYREEMLPLVDRWCEPVVRYGTAAAARLIVSVEAMRGAYPANIFDEFDEAVEFARSQRARGLKPEGR